MTHGFVCLFFFYKFKNVDLLKKMRVNFKRKVTRENEKKESNKNNNNNKTEQRFIFNLVS